MKARYKVYLTDQVYAVMEVKLEIPDAQRQLAEVLGIGAQEQANLVGQKLSEFLQLLGNDDET